MLAGKDSAAERIYRKFGFRLYDAKSRQLYLPLGAEYPLPSGRRLVRELRESPAAFRRVLLPDSGQLRSIDGLERPHDSGH
jgi:hypothetical protein